MYAGSPLTMRIGVGIEMRKEKSDKEIFLEEVRASPVAVEIDVITKTTTITLSFTKSRQQQHFFQGRFMAKSKFQPTIATTSDAKSTTCLIDAEQIKHFSFSKFSFLT